MGQLNTTRYTLATLNSTQHQEPSKWDVRFLHLCELVAGWSKDSSTKCGACVVRPDKTVLSLGYNGFPRGMRDDADLYSDRELKYSRTVHAEVNAILSAHEPVRGCALYTWPMPPCDRCAVHAIQAGVRVVIFAKPLGEFADRWHNSLSLAKAFFAEAGVEYVELTPKQG